MKTTSFRGVALLAIAIIISLGTTNVMAQSLVTDQSDYAPGSTVTLTGSGFSSWENVIIQVLHVDNSGDNDSSSAHQPWSVTADASGNFVATWAVPANEDEAGASLQATADGQSSGAHAVADFTDTPNGTGVVTVTANGASCLGFTAAVGAGPDNWEVAEGGSYTMTISGVTECTGSAITVFVQNSNNGNFCFTATGGSGTYVGNFTMPNPSCNTSPISYKCGADQPCNNSNTYNANGQSNTHKVHLRASKFDGSCNKIADDVLCTDPCLTFLASETHTDVLCHGDNTGTATISATGGTEPYSGTGTFTGLTAGTYTYTVTDANGCSKSVDVTIGEPDELVPAELHTEPLCHGDANGSATISATGGTEPYQGTGTFTGLTAGTYSYTVTDAHGCSKSIDVTIGEPDELMVSETHVDVSTCGGSDGSIDITVTGGTQPYTYLWNDGNTADDRTGLTQGMYSVDVTDDHGCSKSIAIIITQPDCGCTGFRTETQGGYGADPHGNNNGVYVHANFDGAFPTGVTIGCAGATLTLTSAQAVTDFLPSSTTPATLPAGDMVDPGSSYHNVLAGQLMSLALTLGFDQYDPDFSSNSIHIADLFIVNGPFAGWTVGALFAEANNAIGGCSSIYSLSDINDVLDSINNNYDDGTHDNGYLTCAPPCHCQAPGNITVTPLVNDQVTVCWDAQDCATGYILQFQWKGHDDWFTVNVNAPDHCATFSLTGHANINIKVATVCRDGSTTDYSTTIAYRYTTPCTPPTNLTTTNLTATSVTFNWTPGTATTGERVRYQELHVTTSVVKTLSTTATTWTAYGLKPSTTYKWKVKGDCWSPYFKFTTASQKEDVLTSSSETSFGDLSVYPNPASDHLVVEIKMNSLEDQQAIVQIVNMVGQIVYSDMTTVANGTATVNIKLSSELANGLYTLRVLSNDQAMDKKVIINNGK